MAEVRNDGGAVRLNGDSPVSGLPSPPNPEGVADAANHRAVAAENTLRDRLILFAEAEHKLKTGLTIVMGWASLLHTDWDNLSPENRRHGVATILQRATTMSEQSDKLLASLRAEVPTMVLRRRVVLRRFLADAAADFDGMSDQHHVTVEVDHNPVAWVDPELLDQLLIHLLDNAFKYSPSGSTVVLRGHSSGDRVVIEVMDEGSGIPTGVDVFAPFVQGAQAGYTPTGAGLGLYIVANLAQSMGGSVTATRNEVRGSTFTVLLPLYDRTIGPE
jgi:K+-sensing histidine kinase KdpD